MPEPQQKLNKIEGRVWEILMVLTGIMTTVHLGVTSWLALTVIGHGERLVSVEASRYTADDAMEATSKTAAEILAVWQEIARVRGEIAEKADSEDVPDPEVLRWLERHDRDINQIESTINRP